ncbi:MAG TPA: MBOAT family O-acyltransferase [Dokdonella sp.]|uniref:MBOAT family O-acyltransferase n=1 Tax=Dokdonella sp. TaxID=2291710 RepID=UPI002D7F7110|nr:MBOAT family O-acyltransferase [Dokdonella sp.]HET9033902.1 MBOAT family O-acyltransferase [Dokdonella sp.]
MVFSSVTFLFFFLPLTLIFYRLTRQIRWQNAVLLVASIVFYAWGEPRFVPVLAASVVFSWVCGLGISRSDGSKRSLWLGVGVGLNLLLLVVFKYANFVFDNYNSLAVDAGIPSLHIPSIPLALGISFFVFQAISYLVDIYRGQATPARNLGSVALYISMFPQLIAGPIVRYASIDRRLRQRLQSPGRRSYGWKLFVIGLAQKVLVADQVAMIADATWLPASLHALNIGQAWIGLCAYTLQIYFDFAGYSNMAIGIGLMFGFGFPRNFRFPYIARSVTEFWRRWHISLSSWFRDYLYIPLGGNRHGAWRTYRNLLIVFVLCGFWHGASWTFLIWGLHHGLFLVAERTLLRRPIRAAPAWLRHIYLMLVVMTGWVWFRSDTMDQAIGMFQVLFGVVSQSGEALLMVNTINPLTFTALLAGTLFALDLPRRLGAAIRLHFPLTSTNPVLRVTSELTLVSLFVAALSFVASGAFSPFLYFRF